MYKAAFNMVLSMICLFSISSYAAGSFECSQASSSLEQFICNDPNLGSLNETNHFLYTRAQTVDSEMAIEASDKLYVELRKCNDDINCLANAYQSSNDAYQKIINKNKLVVASAQSAQQVEAAQSKGVQINTIKNASVDEKQSIFQRISTFFKDLFRSILTTVVIVVAVLSGAGAFVVTLILFSKFDKSGLFKLGRIVGGKGLVGYLLARILSSKIAWAFAMGILTCFTILLLIDHI